MSTSTDSWQRLGDVACKLADDLRNIAHDLGNVAGGLGNVANGLSNRADLAHELATQLRDMARPPAGDDLITTAEAVALTGRPRRSLERWARENGIERIRQDGRGGPAHPRWKWSRSAIIGSAGTPQNVPHATG